MTNYMDKNSSLSFLGTYSQLPDEATLGDVVFVDDTSYYYTDKWLPINNAVTASPQITEQLPKPTHCPSCGAPLDRYKDKCEYCGSFY